MIVLTVLERAPARANALVLVLTLICSLSLSCTHGHALVFVCFQRIHRSAALFDHARGPCLPADPDAAGNAIARDGAAGRERVAGGCCAEQAAEMETEMERESQGDEFGEGVGVGEKQIGK